MKRVLVILVVLGLAFSPLMVSQASAAPVKHQVAKHHKKHLKKKHASKRFARKHKRKSAA